MTTNICTLDISLLQKKAQRDALGIEILLTELSPQFALKYRIVTTYFNTISLKKSFKKYLENYDLNVCAKCHSFKECSVAFYKIDKHLLSSLNKTIPIIESTIQHIKMPWLWFYTNSFNILQNCHRKLEDRVEDIEIIMETSNGILDELADALDKAEPKLQNWRKALPFLQ